MQTNHFLLLKKFKNTAEVPSSVCCYAHVHAHGAPLKIGAEGGILCWAYAFLDMLVLALKSFFYP